MNTAVPPNNTLSGFISGAGAFLIWGLCPVYWKVLADVPALETITHRVVVINLFLMGTAFLTALPLMLFNIAANRITLTAIGFLQYIAPTVTLLLAVFVYHEPLSTHQLVAFMMIWTALVIYSLDSIKTYKKQFVLSQGQPNWLHSGLPGKGKQAVDQLQKNNFILDFPIVMMDI